MTIMTLWAQRYINHREMYTNTHKSLKWRKYEATGHNMKGEIRCILIQMIDLTIKQWQS